MQTMFNRCDISWIIIKTTIRFDSNHWGLNLKLIQLYYFASLILFDYSLFLQLLNNRWNHFIIKTLPPFINNNTQSFIDLIKLLPWQVAYNLPSFNRLFVITLKRNNRLPRSVTELIINIERFLSLNVKLLQIPKIRLFFKIVRMILYHLRNQHSELCTPIAYMINTINFKSHSLK